MRSLLLFAGTDLSAQIILNQMIPDLVKQGITCVVLQVNPKPKKDTSPFLKDLGFYERLLLNQSILPFVDKTPFPDAQLLTPAQLEQKYKAVFLNCYDVNAPWLKLFLSTKTDVIGTIALRCLQIFKQDMIDAIQEKGFFWNLHPGILPDYKGLYCPVWTRYYNEQHVGWTLHEIDAGIDTGSIIETLEIPYEQDMSILRLYIHMAEQGIAQMILKHIYAYSNNGYVHTTKQDKNAGRYFKFPSSETVQNWTAAGITATTPGEAIALYTDKYSFEQSAHGATFYSTFLHQALLYEQSRTELAASPQTKPSTKHAA